MLHFNRPEQELSPQAIPEARVNPLLDAIAVIAADPQNYAENEHRIRRAVERISESGRAPVLLLVGQSEFLGEMLDTARVLGYPLHRIRLVDAGTIHSAQLQKEALKEAVAEFEFRNVVTIQ